MLKNSLNNKVIIVAPHPDDETLGIGGTLLKHKANNDDVYCIFVTNIDEKHGFDKEIVNQRQIEIDKVSKLYGFNKIYKLNFPTATLTQKDMFDLISKISNIFKDIEPNIIYLPNKFDVHSDHRIIFDATYSCTKSFRYPYIKKILMYETVSETEFGSGSAFLPNYFVNISEYLNKKIEIMKIYKSEVQEFGKPRSLENIKSLAIFRGSMINAKYAEAFHLIKEICDF